MALALSKEEGFHVLGLHTSSINLFVVKPPQITSVSSGPWGLAPLAPNSFTSAEFGEAVQTHKYPGAATS